MKLRLCLLAAAALTACPLASQAQTAPTRLIPQERADQNPRTVRQRQRPGPGIPSRSRARSTPIAAFTLRQVVIQGSTLPADQLEAAWRPFVGQTLDTKGLLKLTDALAAVYDRNDIAIYTVTIPTQTFADGVLRIQALEGYIEKVDVAAPGGRKRAQVQRYIDKLTAERPLHKSTLQRYVSLIRDIPGLDSRMDLVNGDTDTGVIMKLALQPHPVQVAVGVNNRGTAYLGRTQVQADVYLNSLLRDGDQTRLTVAVPTDLERFQSYAIAHSTPIGSDGLTFSANASYLRTRPRDTDILGHATAVGVQLSYPLVRSYDHDVYVTLGLDGVNSDNAFLGFTFANDRSRALRAAISYSAQTDRRLTYVSGTFSQGLDAFGARTTTPGLSELDFRKLNAKAGASFALGKLWAVRFNAAGQWTGDLLPGTEQFALGGDEFGRGYEASVVAGDKGYAGSAELAVRPPKLPALLQGSEAFGFVDGGKVWYKGRFGYPTSTAHLESYGFGVRAQVRNKAVVQLELDRAFDNPQPYLDRGWRGVATLRTLW